MTLLFRFLELVFPAKRVPVDTGPVTRVLVVDLAYIGDMVMSSVAYRAVKKNIPGCVLHALAYPSSRQILSMNDVIDDVKTLSNGSRFRQCLEIFGIRRGRYDLVIHLNTSAWVNFLLLLLGARYRLGYNYRGRGCFLNVRVPIETRTVRTRYRPDECAELLERGLSWTVEDRAPRLGRNPVTREVIRTKLRAWGVADGDLLVALHSCPSHDRDLRCWEAEKFAAVCSDLIRKRGAKIIFTDVADDMEEVRKIWENIPEREGIVDAVGQLSIPELCAVVGTVDLVLTVNTAPLHLAIAQGTPTVAIMGFAPSRIYIPEDNPDFSYVEDPALADYDPHLLRQVYTPRIREIPVGDVLEKIEAVLSRRRPTPQP